MTWHDKNLLVREKTILHPIRNSCFFSIFVAVKRRNLLSFQRTKEKYFPKRKINGDFDRIVEVSIFSVFAALCPVNC